MNYENNHMFRLDEYPGSGNVFFIQKISTVSKAEKLHSHDFIQIYLVTKGILKHTIENKDVLLVKGDMFVIPPFIDHQISRMNEETEFVALSFSLDFIDHKKDKNTLLGNFIEKLITGPNRPVLKIEGKYQVQIYRDILIMFDEFKNKETGYFDVIKGSMIKLISILGRIYSSYESNQSVIERNSFYNASMLNCLDYINQNFYKDLKVEDLTEMFWISRTIFFKLFKLYTRMSFKEYINTLRIDAAQKIMNSCESSIEEVAYKVGYAGTANFYKNFKRFTGVTPSRFKEINRKTLIDIKI